MKFRSGNHQTAIDKLTALRKQFPRHPQVLCNLAAAYLALEKNDQGEALLHQALEAQPDYLIARCSLTGLHLQRNQIEAAEELLQELLNKEQLHISEACNLFSLMALLHQATDETAGVDSCLQMLESLMEQYPNPTEQYLESLYARLGRAPRAPRWLPRLFRGFAD